MKTTLNGQRGSVLLTTLIFGLIIAISVTSYLQLSRTGMQISNRALYLNGSMNLAENGLEEAMYSINKAMTDPTYSWATDGWTVSGANAYRKWTGTALDAAATGETRAYVYNYASNTSPRIVTRSIVSVKGDSNARTLEKWIEVRLRKTSLFANGLVAKDSIAFSGNNASVDSFNSDPTGTGFPIEGYDPTPVTGNRNDNGSVGSISVSVDAVLVQNADIWGYAATGGAAPAVGSNGLIGPFGTLAGDIADGHVSTDFAASFDPVVVPTNTFYPFGASNIGTITLPRGTDVMDADGYYYIYADTMGNSNQVITITGKVVLKLNNSTGDSVDIKGGSGALNITSTGELKIYTAGGINIGGKGLANGTGSPVTALTANQAAKCQIYGTATSGSQSIQVAGNGALSAVVYAPFGSVKINGNGDICGSVVANDITVVGNAKFHYDESLANFGGNNPFRVSLWKELTTATERAAVTSVLTF